MTIRTARRESELVKGALVEKVLRQRKEDKPPQAKRGGNSAREESDRVHV